MVNNHCFWLKNAHVPNCLINNQVPSHTKDNLSLCDLEIRDGKIFQIIPASTDTIGQDLKKGIVLPCFVDVHTHLDKGHICDRTPNLEGNFNTALEKAKEDAQFWDEEDLYKRMEFGLKCSYAHGTIAIRTHLDSFGEQGYTTIKVWQKLKQEWADKITLQAVSLVSLDYFCTPAGIKLADKIAEIGGILGGVVYMNPNIEQELETVFRLAQDRNLDLDFHADENGDMNSICLQKIAQTALKTNFTGNILCGHCCSLAVQSSTQVSKTIELVKQANIDVVSLPMCNLYLQDRKPHQTPLWRGVTRVKELKQAGVKVAFASDNCRDPFFGFGDHDMLEVFSQSVRIAHLDTPYEDWIASVTTIPANLMKLPNLGQITPNSPADLILFKGRSFSELLSRHQCDRTLLRAGKIVEPELPDYSELDNLINFQCPK